MARPSKTLAASLMVRALEMVCLPATSPALMTLFALLPDAGAVVLVPLSSSDFEGSANNSGGVWPLALLLLTASGGVSLSAHAPLASVVTTVYLSHLTT
jgi:hypothetical protein